MDYEATYNSKTGKLVSLHKLFYHSNLGGSFLSLSRFRFINFLIQKKLDSLGYGGSFLSKMKNGSRKVPYKK